MQRITALVLTLLILTILFFVNNIMRTVILSVLTATLFEWTLHRYIMHKPWKARWKWLQKWPWLERALNYAYKAHHVTHHGLFRADKTYHDLKGVFIEKVPMAWWCGPALTTIASLPFFLASATVAPWSVWFISLLVIGAYFAIYEYIHWCMHLPKRRRMEMWRVFQYLNGHHNLHHRYMRQHNFNVVLPLADLLLGTLIVRSKVPYCQAPSPVPNVQPLARRLVAR